MFSALFSAVFFTSAVFGSTRECEEGHPSYWDYQQRDPSTNKPFLCQCPAEGQTVPTCYGPSSYDLYASQVQMESLIRGACSWHFEAHNCSVSSWLMPYGGCPNCRCTMGAPIDWKIVPAGWANQCFGCSCVSEQWMGNYTRCNFDSMMWRASDSCPKAPVCDLSDGGYIANGSVKALGFNGTYYQTNTSVWYGYCKPISHCKNGTTYAVTEAQVKASSALQAGILSDSSNSWGLIACRNDTALWRLSYCQQFQCSCPSNLAVDEYYYRKDNAAQVFSFFADSGMAQEVCQKCTCQNDSLNSQMFPSRYTCEQLGSDIPPINCPPSTSCPRKESSDSSWSTDACMKGDSCHYDSLEYDFPGSGMFTGDLTFPAGSNASKAGCNDEVICTVVGNGNCASATMANVAIWRYNCTSNDLYSASYSGTNKYKCCNGSDSASCGASADLTVCPENSLISNSWSNAFPCLFGDQMRTSIAQLGLTECRAKLEGVTNFWDTIFRDNSCSKPGLMGFMANMAKCYCKYLATFWDSLGAEQKVQIGIQYKNWVRSFMQMMGEGGCVFKPVCHFENATVGGQISSTKVSFAVTVNATISNLNLFCQGIGVTLGVKNSKQVTCTATSSSRRRLSAGEVVQVEANAATAEEQAGIQSNVANVALNGGTVGAATAEIESSTVDDAVANADSANTTTTAISTSSTSAPGVSAAVMDTALNANLNCYLSVLILVAVIMA